MTTATITDRSALAAALRELKLSGMLDTLDARLAQARAGDLGHLDFLQVLCQDEISRRETTSLASGVSARARFEDPRHPGRLRLRRHPRNCPPPRSATSPRCAGCTPANRSSSTARSGSARPTSRRPSAHLAIRRGADARFLKTSRALAHLAGGHADRTWDKRLRELTRPAVLDPGRLRHARVHRRPGRRPVRADHRTRRADPLIFTSNRAPADWYPLFPNPVVAESLLDRLINTSHQVVMNGPSYRPRKRPGRVVPTDTTSTS